MGVRDITDIEAIEKSEMEELPNSTFEVIAQTAAKIPDAPALSFFITAQDYPAPVTWTYKELLEKIVKTANFFQSVGATKDTVIAICLPNLPEAHFAIWGGEATGIVFPINPLLEGHAIADLLTAANAKILVTLGPSPGTNIWAKIAPHLDRVASLQRVLLVRGSNHAPWYKKIIMRGLEFCESVKLSLFERTSYHKIPVQDFYKAIKNQPDKKLNSARKFAITDASSWFCTGGTTGHPKIAMRTHENEVFTAYSLSKVIGDIGGPGKTIFCGLPLFHVNAVMVTGLLPFSLGGHVIMGPPQGYRAPGLLKSFWKIIEYHKINSFSGVPTIFSSLLNVPIDGADISSLEFTICGAAPLSKGTWKSFEEKFNVRILEGYGLTEGTCASSVNPPDGIRNIGSIGLRIPFQSLKAILLDEQGRYLRDCETNEVGLLAIRGKNVFSGYLSESANTNIWIERADSEKWLNTGDLGRIDENGYVWLTGRKKDLIIRGGHNIDPLVIEEPLYRHPDVETAAAIGRPDLHSGEVPVAYVCLKPRSNATEKQLIEYLQTEILEKLALPKQIIILSQMPLTPIGKVHKPSLRRLAIQDFFKRILENERIPAISIEAVDEIKRGTIVRIQLQDDSFQQEVQTIMEKSQFIFEISIAGMTDAILK